VFSQPNHISEQATWKRPPEEQMHDNGTQPGSGGSYVLSWGLISIPVKVFTGTERTPAVKRSMFTDEGHPVGAMSYDKETGDPYDGEVTYRSKASNGVWVELTDEEIATAVGGEHPAQLLSIEKFVPLSALGREYLVEKYDQVRPADSVSGRNRVPNPGAEKAFALLSTAMQQMGVGALVKIARRSSFGYAVITPDGQFVYVLFAEQVRARLALPAVEVADNELALARQLIDAVGVDTPELHDEASTAVLAYVEAKAEGHAPQPATVSSLPTPTIDLAAALAASLEAARAPAVPAKRARAKKAS
jgi:DNA end-binding protein Ku